MTDGHVIAITGGSGSFGIAATRRFLDAGAREVRILSRDPARQDALRRTFDDPRVRLRAVDVRDYAGVEAAVDGADQVIHAAAMKLIPQCEQHPEEAAATNVLGSGNVLRACRATGVRSVVCVSTDKAVHPTSVMGMTKALMERVAANHARDGDGGTRDGGTRDGGTRDGGTRDGDGGSGNGDVRSDYGGARDGDGGSTSTGSGSSTSSGSGSGSSDGGTVVCTVRYGNLLMSAGTVVPLFIAQLRAGAPLTVTDPDMTRFLMSLDGAVDLAQHALTSGRPGDLFVGKAPAATIGDLARAVAELLGADPQIRVIGARPGEKRHEEMLSREELARAVDEGDCYRVPLDAAPADLPAQGYTSANTVRLDVGRTMALLAALGATAPGV